MQKSSVKGAEWIMQIFNVHVWAYDTTIYGTGIKCHVPESCSGLKTATVTFLFSIGLSIYHRTRIKYAIPLAIITFP